MYRALTILTGRHFPGRHGKDELSIIEDDEEAEDEEETEDSRFVAASLILKILEVSIFDFGTAAKPALEKQLRFAESRLLYWPMFLANQFS